MADRVIKPDSGNQLVLQDEGGTAALTIDTSGNVGIGTTNPSSDGGTTLEIYNANTPTIKLNDGGDYKALLQLRGNDTEIRGSSGNMEFYTGNADGASSTERMRITSAGNVGINCQPSYLFHISNGGSAWTSQISNTAGSGTVLMNYWYIENHAPDDQTSKFVHAQDNSANRFVVYSDGDVWTSDNGILSSDERLKENIVDATPKLDDLMRLKVRNFEWKNDYHPNKEGKKMIGFIAQEVEEIFPGLISEQDIASEPKKVFDENGQDITPEHKPVFRKSIKQVFTPMIIKAIQELSAKVTALENA